MSSNDAEKTKAATGDAYPVKSRDGGSDDILSAFSPAEQRRITRHIDRRLVVTIGLLYCVSLMDRTNLGAANIAGLSKDLHLSVGTRYSVVSLVFFVTYILFQMPSTVIVRKIGPRLHLSFITVVWGICMIGMGFVKRWDVLAGLRVLLGILEAGFFPSCVYLLSTWYTRYDLGKRNAMFYFIGCLAAAASGIMAAGLTKMDGLRGLSGWRWIFIIEGVITCLLGFVSYWLVVDFPDSTRSNWSFLSQRELAWVVARVDADRGDAQTKPFALGAFLRAGRDWKLWAYGMMFFNTTTITYALAYFLPQILQDSMGFSTLQAQCLTAPPYAFAGIVMYATGHLGDRYRLRGPIVVINNVLCLVGLPLVGFLHNPAVRYFGVFLVTGGANSNVPALMSYQANNIRGQWKRAFASATFVAMGGLGGICGSLVFRSQDAPSYHPGMYTCIGVTLLTVLLVAGLTVDFKIQNGRADRGEKLLETEGDTDETSFRYTY